MRGKEFAMAKKKPKQGELVVGTASFLCAAALYFLNIDIIVVGIAAAIGVALVASAYE